MRAVIQRVHKASVSVNGKMKSAIEKGLVILVGIDQEDTEDDVFWLAKKISQLRLFSDENDKMNLSVEDIQGQLMIVSQFTLFADIKKGNRPSFTKSAKPEIAIPLYELFIKTMQQLAGKEIQTGTFGAHMDIDLINNGPVTILIDTKTTM